MTWERLPGRSIVGLVRSNGNIIYSSRRGTNGIEFSRSPDQGSSWSTLPPVGIEDFEDFQADVTETGRLFVANSGGIRRFNGTSWQEVGRSGGIAMESFGDRDSAAVKCLAIDPNHPQVVYAGLWAPSLGHREYFIYRSQDGGTTWQDFRANLPGFSRTWALTINPFNSDVHISTDHGNYLLPYSN